VIIKGGFTAWSQAGDASASIGLADPLLARAQWGAKGKASARLGATFVHPLAIEAGLAERLSLDKPMWPLAGTRTLRKQDMMHNDVCPQIEVNPQTFDVYVDGELAVCEPLSRVTLGQKYLLR